MQTVGLQYVTAVVTVTLASLTRECAYYLIQVSKVVKILFIGWSASKRHFFICNYLENFVSKAHHFTLNVIIGILKQVIKHVSNDQFGFIIKIISKNY